MLVQGKKALIFGVANDKSIAYAIAKELRNNGASIALSYAGEALKKRVEPIHEELGGDFLFQCDVTDDQALQDSVNVVQEHWGTFDILVHSVAFANRDDLKGRYVETSRAGFHLAMDVSAYSLVALCQAYESILNDNASIMAMTYYGAEKVITNYNVMGVAKAALEASVRYLAMDLGERGIRVNAISAGPLKTLAASGISGFKTILATIEERAPLRRNIVQEDVGRTGLFLASDLSSAITGEVIHVDAGYNIMGI
ncbi:MAG: enoyl-ACP reductase [Desulfovibrionales bacterium]|nr:enoyl-ACP reductase [Desulfovibrionales bacterium]